MEEIVGASEMSHHQSHQRRLLPRKMVLCVWWDCKGILCYELLLGNQTINSNKNFVDEMIQHIQSIVCTIGAQL